MTSPSSATSPSARATSFAAALLLLASVSVAVLGGPAPALADGGTLAVSTTVDSDGNGACSDSTVTTQAGEHSLRNALCVASNAGGAWTIAVPAGTYQLDPSLGALTAGTLPGASITVQGASSSTTRIVGDGQHQLLVLDPEQRGGVSAALSGLAFTGGVDNVFGGGAVIGGSGLAAQKDTLSIADSAFTGNKANTTGTSTANPGGAVQFLGGSLTVSGSTFSGNDSGTSPGGAIAYQAMGTAPGQSLSISGSTFSGNHATPTGPGNGGAALSAGDTTGSATMTVASSSFTGNTASGGGGTFHGSAIWLDGGALGVTGSTFTGNTNDAAGGSALAVTSGVLTAGYDRIAGNSAPALAVVGGTAVATRDWWGCPGGPGAAGCDTVSPSSSPIFSPYLTLGVTASPSPIVAPASTSTVTASLLKDSAGGSVSASDLSAFAGLPVAWTTTGTGSSAVPSSSALANGVATTTFQKSADGAGTVSATLDNGAATASVPRYSAPGFTSPATVSAVVGQAASITVTTSGYPAPALSLLDALPAGLVFADDHDGTATISGTPAAGTAGDHAVTVQATNAVTSASEPLTLSIDQAPAFSSGSSATFTAGSAGSFAVTTTGRPAPHPITVAGSLPSGVLLTDHGDGTATLSGTPATGSGGTYSLTLQTTNGIGAPAAQSFTLTVQEAPRITSGTQLTATLGEAIDFPVTTAHAYPVPTLSAGTLPAGLTFADHHDGTASITGTPTGPAGTTTVPVTASNGVGSDAIVSLLVTIRQAPAIVDAPADQQAIAGSPVSFTVTANGYPAPSVQWSVSTDGGATYAPIDGATSGTLTFTASVADDGNRYRATFTNTVGSVSADARLSVGTVPGFTSPASAMFTAGGAPQSFTVTTSEIPKAALTTGGTLPAWLAFTDNGDGTATIAGAPPAGSGGAYPFTITASNGYGTDATQAFMLTVDEAPVFTSPASGSLTAGTAGTVLVTTTPGFPAATTISVSGALPDGVVFTDLGDGSATLTGTPAAGTGGVHTLAFTAGNGAGGERSQSFALTVTEAASITAPSGLTVTRGVVADLAIRTGHAYPAVDSLSLSGPLPAGLAFTDDGDGTATIAGTTIDPAGAVTLTVTAHATGAPDVTQTLLLTLEDARVVALPLIDPTTSLPLGGVPASPEAGDSVTLVADGFASDAPVTFGIYSSPVTLAIVDADATGTARATVTIPAGYTGAHSLVATGIGPDGSVRTLRSDITLPTPSGPGDGGSSGGGSAAGGGSGSGSASGSGDLARTGLDASGPLLLALALLAAGAVALRRRPGRS